MASTTSKATSKASSPLETARRLAPLIRSYVEQIEETRELPRPLFEALFDAGLFRLLIPRSMGGAELDLPTYVEVIEAIGRSDASTAWAINQGGVWATYTARLPRDLAREIWVETPRGVVANAPTPDAVASVVEDGYRVTGRLGFSTGCRHASWFAANARIHQDGRPRLLPSGQAETRYLMVPAAEAEILDTWHVRGMRGTGTHNFAVNDVFVPDRRTFFGAPTTLFESGPLYVIPRTLLFASGDAAVALGVARASIEAFVDLASGKTAYRMAGALREQAMVQAAVGKAEADLRAARAFLFEAAHELWRGLCQTGEAALEPRVQLRTATTHAIRTAVQVVDSLYNHAGATAVYQSCPLQRYFQDIHVISQHIQSRLTNYELVGRYYVGLEPDLNRL